MQQQVPSASASSEQAQAEKAARQQHLDRRDALLQVGGAAHAGGMQQAGDGDGTKPRLHLFIGILSARGFRHRRAAVREAWADRAQAPGVSMARFILSQDEATAAVQNETRERGDMLLMAGKTTYQSILLKTFFLFKYAVTTYDVSFIMKTDDDAFVNVPWLLFSLRKGCVSEGCRHERLYMGRMAANSPVLLRPGHRWANEEYFNHTGLRVYPKYAMGGGYVLSGDVAAMLIKTQAAMGLKFGPIEDAMIGTWLMAMDLRHVSHRRFWTFGSSCCFKPPARRNGTDKAGPAFQLQRKLEKWMCSGNPWLVLHKIDSPNKMRYMGQRFAECPALL